MGAGHRWSGAILLAARLGGPGIAAVGRAGTSGEAWALEARARYLMGTRLSITLPAPARDADFEAAFGEVARLEEVMSNWRETSEVSRLNRGAAGGPFRCSAELLDAVRLALRWAEETGGAFEPTVEPLVRELGLRGPEGRLPELGEGGGAAPAEPETTGAGARVPPIGWRHVRIEEGSRSVTFDTPGVGIDLGGIGKGIALDAAARVLKGRGWSVALLDFGGQILAIGSPPGALGWPVGIAAPGSRDTPAAWIDVRNRSVSTSGNDERSVSGPLGIVGHILDAALRGPARFAGSVTVVADDATSADALSTALFVMGPEQGIRWAGERGLAVLYLWREAGGDLESRSTADFSGPGLRTPPAPHCPPSMRGGAPLR